jgi:site-specific DNA recombinase
MESTNGYGPKRAILYARVSGDEQAKKGYSLSDQGNALRQWAGREGYEVFEEVADEGWSGAYLERPGLDRVRHLVAEGGVDVVAVLFRDRVARGVYAQLLMAEFAERGTRLVALNAQLDDSPEGELQGGILDQFAAYERAKIAERTRRGRLRKAKEGKILGAWKAPFGFDYNEARDGLVINESEMAIVEKIFRMAAEGLGTTAMQSRLRSEAVPSPNGGKVWAHPILRRIVFNDVYKPHSYSEIGSLISDEVASRLDENEEYGVWWWNRHSVKQRTVSEPDHNGGKRYRKRTFTTLRPEGEWIGVPVPAYLNRPLVDLARDTLEANKGFDRKHPGREWELRGLVWCRCGWRMRTHQAKGKGGVRYWYYNCRKRAKYGGDACSQKSLRAEDIEGAVWRYAHDLLLDPEKVRIGMDRLIEEERSAGPRDPAQSFAAWVEKLDECDRKRRAYQDQQAAGLMTLEELTERLEELEGTRRLAQAELEALADREGRARELERHRDALLEEMASLVPERLERLPKSRRNGLYRALRLRVEPVDKGYWVHRGFCTPEPIS